MNKVSIILVLAAVVFNVIYAVSCESVSVEVNHFLDEQILDFIYINLEVEYY